MYASTHNKADLDTLVLLWTFQSPILEKHLGREPCIRAGWVIMTQQQYESKSDTVQAIKPHTHEFGAYLQYTENNLAPYYALGERIERKDGYIFTDIDVSDEIYELEIDTYQSGLEDPNSDTSAYGITINFERQDSVGEKSGTFMIEPRFINTTSTDSDSPDPSIPDINDGQPYFTVDIRASNLELNEYQQLLQRIFDTFDIDVNVHSPHNSSTVHTLSQEVRLDREVINPLIGYESIIRQLSEYLQIDGYNSKHNGTVSSIFERLDFASDGMSDLFDGHTLGKSLKLYFVKNPPDNPENPLHHPKLCVTLNDENVKWGNISDARRELNELLINVLSWADLRIRSNEAFISDAYFTAEDTTHCIDIIEDPLPALEKNQQAKIQGLSMNSDLTESQLALIDVLDELEQTTVNEITEKIDFSQRTVYRCLDALHDIVTLDNGSVEFATEFLQTGISSLLSKAKSTIESASKGARDKFKLWQESHGVDIEKDGRLIMRFGEIGNNDIDELLRQAQKYYTGEHRVSFAKVTYEKYGQPLAKPLGYNFRR